MTDVNMTDAADPDAVLAALRDNALWVEETARTGEERDLRFLRYRPEQELADGLAMATRMGLPLAKDVFADAHRCVAKTRGQGYSRPPTGYTGVVYPVSLTERAEVLARYADALRETTVVVGPGWALDVVDVTTQSEDGSVVLRAVVTHPTLPGPDPDPRFSLALLAVAPETGPTAASERDPEVTVPPAVAAAQLGGRLTDETAAPEAPSAPSAYPPGGPVPGAPLSPPPSD